MFHAPGSHPSLLGSTDECPAVLLQLWTSLIEIIPSARNSVPEIGFSLAPAFLMSAALTPFSPSFVAAEIRAESSADYLSRGPALPLLFPSRTSSPLFSGKDFSTVQMQLFPLEVISRRYDGLLKIRRTMRAAWPETWPSGLIYGDYRDPLSQRSILLSACKFSKKM